MAVAPSVNCSAPLRGRLGTLSLLSCPWQSTRAHGEDALGLGALREVPEEPSPVPNSLQKVCQALFLVEKVSDTLSDTLFSVTIVLLQKTSDALFLQP